MAVRRNLCPNPALKVDTTGWFGQSGWARTTTAHATLPRTTGFAGSTPGNVVTRRWPATPGLSYVGSVAVRFTAASTGIVAIDWYTAGGVYLSTSNGPSFDQTGGTTATLPTGVAVAPPNAAEGAIVVVGLDGAAEITAVLVEQTATTGGVYFDGDSTNSVWDGTNGASASTETTAAPVVLTGFLPAPAGRIVGVRESFGALTGALVPPLGATGVIASVNYDRTRGRVRISVQGLAVSVVRAVVYSRRTGTTRWSPVRGGRVAVVAGRFVRTVDDYEFAAGTGMDYQIVGLSNPENIPDVPVQTQIVSIPDTIAQIWIKFIPTPAMNRQVILAGVGEIERPDRNATFDVVGRRDPVVITEVHGSRRTTITLLTENLDEGDALDQALSSGAPAFLHVPVTVPVPSMYIAVGRYSWEILHPLTQDRLWTVQVTEVAPPPLSVVGVGTTWQTLLDQSPTWADVLNRYPTWADVAS